MPRLPLPLTEPLPSRLRGVADVQSTAAGGGPATLMAWNGPGGAQPPASANARPDPGLDPGEESLRARMGPPAPEAQTKENPRADCETGWRPGAPYEPYAERAAELLPACIEQLRAEWPSYEEAHPPPTEEELAEWEDVAEEEPKPAPEEKPEGGLWTLEP